MIGYRNPAAFLRRVTLQLREIKKREEWGIYLAVACSCMVISLLLIIDVAYAPAAKNLAVQGQAHITLHTDVPTFAIVEPEPAISVSSASVNNEKNKSVEDDNGSLSGEWYYDEVHQDWRYKKSE